VLKSNNFVLNLAHLLGVRMCLFPWLYWWRVADELVDIYLKMNSELTHLGANLLGARLT